MSDNWKKYFEENNRRGAEQPLSFEPEPLPGGAENWREAFDTFGEETSDELGPIELPVEEVDTFPVDTALFGPESAFQKPSTDTSVIPPGISDLSAFTGGEMSLKADDADEDNDMDDDDVDSDIDDDVDDDMDDMDPEDIPVDDRHHRAIRRRRRHRTGCMGGIMYAVFILGISTIFAFVAWLMADDVLGLTREDTPIEITVPQNFTIEELAENLYANGVINYRWLFTWYVNFFDQEGRIQPGVYQVRPADFRAIIGGMNQRTGAMVEVRVTIPEGRTMLQTFEILEDHNVSTVDALLYAAENGEFNFDFLNAVPLNAQYRLQGYLFPDTYDFFLHQDPEAVIRRMLRNFDDRMRQNDVYELLEDSDYTLHEVVNIAAMIEREMASGDEAPRIASVIYNRLDVPMRLQIDATIQFILPEVVEFLTYAHTEIPSPWNTYYVDGLPYGPIANPGMAAILGALQPEDTNFLFYALHIDGHHEFFRNFDQHTAFMNTPNFAHHSDNR